MHRKTCLLLASILAMAGCSPAADPSTPPSATLPSKTSGSATQTLYERVAAKLAGRKDLDSLGQPPKELQALHWMLGDWKIEATVFATPSAPARTDRGKSTISNAIGGTWMQMADSYPEGTQDLGFLTYNPVTKRWVSLGLDSSGNAVLSSGAAWQGDRLELIATKVEILGEVVTLRQTMTKVGPGEFTLRNEEQRADGTWEALDEYRYRRAGR